MKKQEINNRDLHNNLLINILMQGEAPGDDRTSRNKDAEEASKDTPNSISKGDNEKLKESNNTNHQINKEGDDLDSPNSIPNPEEDAPERSIEEIEPDGPDVPYNPKEEPQERPLEEIEPDEPDVAFNPDEPSEIETEIPEPDEVHSIEHPESVPQREAPLHKPITDPKSGATTLPEDEIPVGEPKGASRIDDPQIPRSGEVPGDDSNTKGLYDEENDRSTTT